MTNDNGGKEMANPIRLPGAAPKTVSRSKVVPVARPEFKNRNKKQKRAPHGRLQTRLKKELASKKRDGSPTSSRPLSPKEGSPTPAREKRPKTSDSRQGNLINIRI
jgi:hypothetical protein